MYEFEGKREERRAVRNIIQGKICSQLGVGRLDSVLDHESLSSQWPGLAISLLSPGGVQVGEF